MPNQVSVIGVRVSDAQIGAQGLGLLVGMDIISMGDLSVSNFDNKTTISFRMPSKKKTDYVAVCNNEIIKARIGAHGKGKRKKVDCRSGDNKPQAIGGALYTLNGCFHCR